MKICDFEKVIKNKESDNKTEMAIEIDGELYDCYVEVKSVKENGRDIKVLVIGKE